MKMTKRTHSVPFTEETLSEITKIIRSTFKTYLSRDVEAKVDQKAKRYLEAKAKDQLACFIQDLGPSHEKFTFSHSKLPIVIQADCEKENTLMNFMETTEETEAYLKVKDSWCVVPKGTQGSISCEELNKEVIDLIKESAATAAFYSIESYVAAGRQYKDYDEEKE